MNLSEEPVHTNAVVILEGILDGLTRELQGVVGAEDQKRWEAEFIAAARNDSIAKLTGIIAGKGEIC